MAEEQPTQRRYIEVAIKDELKPKLPFKEMKSRLATAEILAFAGYDYRIFPIMQQLSHTSRAYAINCHGMRGFVNKGNYDMELFQEISWAKGFHEHLEENPIFNKRI